MQRSPRFLPVLPVVLIFCTASPLSQPIQGAGNDLSAVPRGTYPAGRKVHRVPDLKKLVDRPLKNAFLYGDFWVKEVSGGMAVLQPYSGLFGIMGKITDPELVRRELLQNGQLYLGATRILVDTSTLPIALEESYPLQISAEAPLELHKVTKSPSGNIVAQAAFRSGKAPSSQTVEIAGGISPDTPASIPPKASLAKPTTPAGAWAVDQTSQARVWVKSVSSRRAIRWSGGRNNNGEAHGPGTLVVLFDGAPVATYTGEMRDGRMSGQVEAVYHKTRQRYSGEIADWDENGQGTMWYPDGVVKTGLWRAGEFVSAVPIRRGEEMDGASKALAAEGAPAAAAVKADGPYRLDVEGTAYARAAQNCEALIRETARPLLEDYDAHRRALAEHFQKSGNLQQLLIVKNGMETREVSDRSVPELNTLQESLLSRVSRLHEEISAVAVALCGQRIKELTIQGDLESAQILQRQEEAISRDLDFGTRSAEKASPERLLQPKRAALLQPVRTRFGQHDEGTSFYVHPGRADGFFLTRNSDPESESVDYIALAQTDFEQRQDIRKTALSVLRTSLFFDESVVRERAIEAARVQMEAATESQTRASAMKAQKEAENLHKEAAAAAADVWAARKWSDKVDSLDDLTPLPSEWLASAANLVERWNKIEPYAESSGVLSDGATANAKVMGDCLAEMRCLRLALAFSEAAKALKAGDGLAAQKRARTGIQLDYIAPDGERAALRQALVDTVTLLDAQSAKAQEHREKAASLSKLGRSADAIQELQAAFAVFPDPEIPAAVQKLRSESLGL